MKKHEILNINKGLKVSKTSSTENFCQRICLGDSYVRLPHSESSVSQAI